MGRLNHTELYQLCRNAGIAAPPNATKEQFISYLRGDIEVPFPEGHPIDAWRHGIIGFLNDYWATLEPQIKCPAKNLRHPTSPVPKPCFSCLDTQVIACLAANDSKVEQLVQLHRPSKGTDQ